MRGILVFLLVLMISCVPTTEPDADGSDARPDVLASDASADAYAILGAGVDWLVHEGSYRPTDIVLDTARSDPGRSPNGRGAALALLSPLARERGLGRGSEADVTCPEGQPPRARTGCRIRGGTVLVSFMPPEHGDLESPTATVVVGLSGPIAAEGAMQARAYRLHLRRQGDGGWVVVRSELLWRS